MFWLFAMEPASAAMVMARRTSAMFAGLGVMFCLAAAEPPSAAREAISLGMAATVALLAIAGIANWVEGSVGPGIWLAIVTELTFAVGLFLSRNR